MGHLPDASATEGVAVCLPRGGGLDMANLIDRRLRGVLALSWLAAFTPILDLDVVTTALPRIGLAFGVGASELAWVVNAYIITFAVSILAVGSIGDAIGRRRVLVGGAALFGLATAGAAMAPNLPVLLAMRALQGLGGSAMLTTSLAVVSTSFEGPVRARALGLYFSGGALGGVLGPVVGGVLVSAFGWRAMFAVQIPLAIGVALLALAVLPESRGRARGLDLPGLALAGIGVLGLNVALLGAHDWGWLSLQSVVAWSLAAFVAFPRVGALLPRIGERRLMVGSLALTASMIALLSTFDGTVPLLVIVPILVVVGFTMAASIVTSAAAAVGEFPPQEAGTASGVFNSIRQLGSVLGVALPAAAYDLAAGGQFAGDAVFDGTRVALGLAAVIVAACAIVASRLLAAGEATSRAVTSSEAQPGVPAPG
jgi:DHA2 family methylenomycin A resistance protein-like MFS transporter